MEEMNLEEMFDFGPTILSEIYTSQLQPRITSDNHAISRKANNIIKHQLITSKSWINSSSPQEIISCNNPSSSSTASASASASASAAQFISFESLNTSSQLPANSDTAHNYNSNVLEMDKDYNSITPQIINFSSNYDSSGDYDEYNDAVINGISQKRVCAASRTPSQAQDHLMAERKRREKLAQLFISLSKVVPGLKKLDKASLLEDAINYVKALQERVSVLEEEEMIKKSSMEEESSNINYDNLGSTGQTGSPEIKARISNRNVLIKICCKKEMGLMSRIPSEMEKMHLSVVDMRFMPFGGTALDITILAEMHNEFRGTVKDIVDHLQMVFAEPASGH